MRRARYLKALLGMLFLLMVPSAAEPVTVSGTVGSYNVGDYHDHYTDGTFAIFDTTEIHLVEPEGKRGETLVIVHSYPASEESLYRKEGSEIHLTLDSRYWDVSGVVHDGAVLQGPCIGTDP